ncbi:hypothetical protein [Arcanobacterium bovis]|uniref:Centromere-binding protein ParB C-terminal domain-containing protein n=1 Tax=Arcanobacterium bovis TaxID=2529275 RepID=A0A4Q9UYT1_9ACTO|nr:hypothetical protein [Arcanobacterium bovis]TBW20733.1 hypothetical protein EZJ44_08415 [Arcanobacterium bovis]
MKLPDRDALSKATINDPIIAGNTSEADSAVSASNATKTSRAVSAGMAGKSGDLIKKFTIRVPESLLGRIRAAYLNDLANGHEIVSLSTWASEHLEKAVIDSENAYNDGEPYREVGVGTVPLGRI